MNIEIKPDGTVRVESNGSTPAELAGFTLSMQRELRKQASNGADRPVSLNDLQGATYDWMVENDCAKGIHLSAIGKQFGITTGAASHRMDILVRDGFVRRVGSGLYRAVSE